MKSKYVTVVYEIVDFEEWGKLNPLKYEHNGLKAIGIALDDLMQKVENLEQILDGEGIDYP
jgi:hypothetical protein